MVPEWQYRSCHIDQILWQGGLRVSWTVCERDRLLSVYFGLPQVNKA